MEQESFYRTYGHNDNLTEGASVKIEHRVEFNTWRMDFPEMVSLVKLSPKELKKKRADTVEREKETFGELQAKAKEWEERAAQTLLLDKALEYVQTPEVKHTSNEWVRREDGVWEISNRVYEMCYEIHQETDGNHNETWLVTWGIAINAPKRPLSEKYPYTGAQFVVEEKKKRYNAEADAQNYIQGRFDVYAHLFTELSPPVPDQFKRNFYINGCLLPGYTVLPKEQSVEETAEQLLAFLDDVDASAATPGPDQSEPPSSPAHAPTKKAAGKKKSATAR